MIDSLPENHIFVFGSNFLGKHGRGSARDAFVGFGAVQGIGEGLEGQSYAFPTKRTPYESCDEQELLTSIENMISCADDNPDLTFVLTKVGCGLAGFTETYMRSLFTQFTLPTNIQPYENWLDG